MYEKKPVPAIYFPSTLLMLDDDALFLKSFSSYLCHHHSVTTFTDTNAALTFIQEKNHALLASLAELKTSLRDGCEYESFSASSFDFNKLQALCLQSEQQDHVSVAIVDYTMPDMNGVEFCKQLKGLPTRKVMLTGNADYETAVQAFNLGVINHFVIKDLELVNDKILETLRDQQVDFFRELTRDVINVIAENPQSALHLEAFQNLINSRIEAYTPSVYCIVDVFGSYMFIKDSGEKVYVIIRPESEFSDCIDILENSDVYDNGLLNQIQSKQALPVFLTETSINASVENWSEYMQPFSRLEQTGFYYSTLVSQ